MDLSVFFAGTGGSVPTARRGLPAVLVRRGGERLLFDCGEGTQRQLVRSVGLVDLDEIYLTHFHADHWLGLPGLLKTFDLRGRERVTTLISGPVELEQHGLWELSVVVLVTTIAAPLAKLVAMIWVLVGVRLRRPPRHLLTVFRWVEWLSPWAMVEVFLLACNVPADTWSGNGQVHRS